VGAGDDGVSVDVLLPLGLDAVEEGEAKISERMRREDGVSLCDQLNELVMDISEGGGKEEEEEEEEEEDCGGEGAGEVRGKEDERMVE
jgi:hypothetical protein